MRFLICQDNPSRDRCRDRNTGNHISEPIFIDFSTSPFSFRQNKVSHDPDGTRTHNPQLRRLMPYPLGHWVTARTPLSQRPLTRCHHHAPRLRPAALRRAVWGWEAAPTAAARAPALLCAVGLDDGQILGRLRAALTPRALLSAGFWGRFFSLGAHFSHLVNFKQNSASCAPPTLILFPCAGPGVCVLQSSPGPSSARGVQNPLQGGSPPATFPPLAGPSFSFFPAFIHGTLT